MAKRTTNSRPNAAARDHLPVLKTYKLYIGGQFPRTESGRDYRPEAAGRALGNICLASRKDFRNAVVAARNAVPAWAGKSAFNRGQILYRIAELLQGRQDQFVAELQSQGFSKAAAAEEVQMSIDRWVIYAGWCDKYQQIFSSVNPVNSSHFNFSLLEPMEVVVLIANETSPLLGLTALAAPILAGGNCLVVLASESRPLSAITLSEVLHTSDMPPGAINILTGRLAELAPHIGAHMDLNAIAFDRIDNEILANMQTAAANNVKRLVAYQTDWRDGSSASPYLIQEFSEVKTTWHPMENISASGPGY
jgi:acyl-CoA reductase-like NAD-dependent aldehyde dehydrogenase